MNVGENEEFSTCSFHSLSLSPHVINVQTERVMWSSWEEARVQTATKWIPIECRVCHHNIKILVL